MGLLTFTGMVQGDTTRTYYESEEEKATRLAFEKSHTFKVGDEVYLTASWLAKPTAGPRHLYADSKGTISKVKTHSEGGPCIRVNFGGTHINIWNPNEELIRVDTATEALYEK